MFAHSYSGLSRTCYGESTPYALQKSSVLRWLPKVVGVSVQLRILAKDKIRNKIQIAKMSVQNRACWPGHLAVVDREPRSSSADEAGCNGAASAPVGLLHGFSSTTRRKHFTQRWPLFAARVMLTHKYRLLVLPAMYDNRLYIVWYSRPTPQYITAFLSNKTIMCALTHCLFIRDSALLRNYAFIVRPI